MKEGESYLNEYICTIIVNICISLMIKNIIVTTLNTKSHLMYCDAHGGRRVEICFLKLCFFFIFGGSGQEVSGKQKKQQMALITCQIKSPFLHPELLYFNLLRAALHHTGTTPATKLAFISTSLTPEVAGVRPTTQELESHFVQKPHTFYPALSHRTVGLFWGPPLYVCMDTFWQKYATSNAHNSVFIWEWHTLSAQSHCGWAQLIASFERSQGHTGIITVLSAPFPQEIIHSILQLSHLT